MSWMWIWNKKRNNMKWLTIEYIKQHSRIEYDCEDALLELYGESAEETVLNVIGRTYDEVVEKYGTNEKKVPAALIHASLLLVDLCYQQRNPVSIQSMYAVPYRPFDMMVKPYMKLADEPVIELKKQKDDGL